MGLPTKELNIKCDSCEICIGPNFTSKHYFEVGPSKLCYLCYRDLQEMRVLILGKESKTYKYTVIKRDGIKSAITKEEILKILQLSQDATKPQT